MSPPSIEPAKDVQSHVVRSMDPDAAVYFFFRFTAASPAVPAAERPFARMVVTLLDEKSVEPKGDFGPLFNVLIPEREQRQIWSEHSQLFTGGSKDPDDPSPARSRKAYSVNLALTWTGLRALGVHDETLASFPEDFRQGMAARARMIGDVGENAPENWHGWLGSREVHGLLWVNFRRRRDKSHEELLSRVAQALGSNQEEIKRRYGIEVLWHEVGWSNFRRDDSGDEYRIEHFGFRDGISQPFADIHLAPPPRGGGTARSSGTWDPVAPGELLLGLPDEDGLIQQRPNNKALRDNGTYLVFRKLEQDVVAFRHFLARHDGPSAPQARLGSQMMGRWPNGTPLVVSPHGPRNYAPATVEHEINDFRYRESDPEGRRCPIGAHIRRSNPRDTNSRDEVRRHRVWRRALSYGGAPLPAHSNGDGVPRGLLFMSLSSRIDQQFEFVQQRWLNSGEFVGQAGAGRCPIVGDHRGALTDQFFSADRPGPVSGLPSFVHLRGGDYFFVPSLSALRKLVEGETFPPEALRADAPAAGPLVAAFPECRPEQNPNPSLAGTPEIFDATKLFCLGLAKLLPAGSPSFLPITVPYQADEVAAPTTRTIALFGRHKYVRRVLDDDERFAVTPYAEAIGRITGGRNMLIGMGRGDPERPPRIAAWSKAVAAYRGPPVEAIVARAMTQILARCGPAGKLDIVRDVGRVIPLIVAKHYYGIEGPSWLSPTLVAMNFNQLEITAVAPDWLAALPRLAPQDIPFASLQGWTRCAFLQVFVNSVVRALELAEAAERTTGELLRHIEDLVERAYRMEPNSRSLVGCIAESIRQQRRAGANTAAYEQHARLALVEMVVGATDSLNKALANVVNHLLDHPDRLKTARDNLGDLKPVTYECLRFDPVSPLLFRLCVRDATIGGLQIKAGTVVCLLLKVAMFDHRDKPGDQAFPDPTAFKLDRPYDRYLHWGFGMHRCAGRDDAEKALSAMLVPLLPLRNLRRAAGPLGAKQETLRLPDSLLVRFAPA